MSEFQNDLVTVAIVEDDPMVRRVTQGFIDKMDGYINIDTYASIEEAQVGLMRRLPMLVLLDVFFSKSSGLELLKWIRKNDLDTDVVLITADHSSKSIETAMRYGAIDYLVKPFRFSRFEEALFKFVKIRDEIQKSKQSNQEKIDLLMNRSNLELEESQIEEDIDIEKAFEKEKLEKNKTYNMIIDFFDKNPKKAYTAAMLGQELGIARITARRYLDKMEEDGSVILSPEYGTIGRPKNYYKRSNR